MNKTQRLQRIESLWHQWNDAKVEQPQVAGGLFRALDKTINPEAYKNQKPVKFEVGDRIKVSYTVVESILHGKRRHKKRTVTHYGHVVPDVFGDEKWKDERIRVEFDDELDKFHCPLCRKEHKGRLGFRCLPDDLFKVSQSET